MLLNFFFWLLIYIESCACVMGQWPAKVRVSVDTSVNDVLSLLGLVNKHTCWQTESPLKHHSRLKTGVKWNLVAHCFGTESKFNRKYRMHSRELTAWVGGFSSRLKTFELPACSNFRSRLVCRKSIKLIKVEYWRLSGGSVGVHHQEFSIIIISSWI